MDLSILPLIALCATVLQVDYRLRLESDSTHLQQCDPLILRLVVANESKTALPSLLEGNHGIRITISPEGNEDDIRVARDFTAREALNVWGEAGNDRLVEPNDRESRLALVLWSYESQAKNRPNYVFARAGTYLVRARLTTDAGQITSEPLRIAVSTASNSHVAAAEVGMNELGKLLVVEPLDSLDVMPRLTAESLNRHLTSSHLKTFFHLSRVLRDIESSVIHGEVRSGSRAELATIRPNLPPLLEQVAARRLAEFYLRENHLNDAQREADRLDSEMVEKAKLLQSIQSRRTERKANEKTRHN